MGSREALASNRRSRSEQDLSKGYTAILATIFIWSTPSLFLFYLNEYYEPWSQNFYRYAIGCLAVAPFVFFRFRDNAPRISAGVLVACLAAALPNVIHQVSQSVALFYMGPGVYAIFTRTSVIITALLALIFFPEERWVIRQWRFQVGTLLGLFGAVGVVWFKPGEIGGSVALRGLAFGFIGTFCWALYGVLVKRPSAALGPVRSFGLISFLTSLFLLPLTLLFGKIATPLHVGLQVNAVLIVSAVLCISLAHVLYYVAIRELGVALSQTLQLVCPAIALGLSAWFFGERLTSAQLASAVVLLLGAFLAMQVKPAAIAESAENI